MQDEIVKKIIDLLHTLQNGQIVIKVSDGVVVYIEHLKKEQITKAHRHTESQ